MNVGAKCRENKMSVQFLNANNKYRSTSNYISEFRNKVKSVVRFLNDVNVAVYFKPSLLVAVHYCAIFSEGNMIRD